MADRSDRTLAPVILITTAINPPQGIEYLKMTDPARRLVASRAGIYFWAAQGARRIVIADATDARCLPDEDVRLLADMGCTVEQIAYRQDEAATIERGKGHAEGRLIAFALEKSVLLGQSDGFFKCTGKFFCRNFKAITELVTARSIQRIVWFGGHNGLFFNQVDLRFFLADRRLFTDVMLGAYLASHDSSGPMAEAALTQALAGALRRGTAPRPKLSGFAGGFDEQAPEPNLGDLDAQYPCLVSTA